MKFSNTPYHLLETPNPLSYDWDKIFSTGFLYYELFEKSYADHRTRDLEFEEGDKVYLKISPMKVVVRFGKKGRVHIMWVLIKSCEGLVKGCL